MRLKNGPQTIWRIVVIALACVALTSCASPAKPENMSYVGDPFTYTEALTDEINVAQVDGGKDTNPLWTSQISSQDFRQALEQSLRSQSLFSENGRYSLRVEMVALDQPIFGLNFTVKSFIRYTLVDLKTESVLLDETITAEHTASVGDAFAAIKRLRLANEGSARANITELLKKLADLNLSDGGISLPS